MHWPSHYAHVYSKLKDNNCSVTINTQATCHQFESASSFAVDFVVVLVKKICHAYFGNFSTSSPSP